MCLTNTLNVSEIRVTAKLKRVGHSLALFIPAPDARRARLREGQAVDTTIRTEVPEPLGLLRDLRWRPFRRERDRDRI